MIDLTGKRASPVVIALHGPPGAGKSTLARAVSRHLGWPLIDKDDIKDLLDGHVANAGGLSYEIMLNLVERQLRQGVSVVCDSPLLARTYGSLALIADETPARLLVVSCRCLDPAVWRARVEARQSLGLPAHHTTTWAQVERFLAQPGADYPVAGPHLIVDSTRQIETLVAQLLAALTALDE